MAQSEVIFLYDHTENTVTRFVSFVGETTRFDLALMTSTRFFGKKLVTDIQKGKTAIIGPDDLEEEGYIEYAFGLAEDEAAELTEFLLQVI